VRVVVDYGTLGGAPSSSPNTHCVSSDGTAAEVLAARASAIGAPAPRYRGNFLCAIDGYPKEGCGDHGTEPYWSLWLWVNGQWTYSSLGVDTYTVRDADKDGHPDPIGFRYHEFQTKRQPRANPSYPAPTTRPPAPHPTTAPPRATTPPHGTAGPTAAPHGGGDATAAPGGTATAGPGATGPAGTPGATGATGATGAAGGPTPGAASGAAPGSASGAATPGTPDGTGEPGAPDGMAGAPPVFDTPEGGGFPWGALGGGLLALGLIGAGAYRARRT
jgi:hypothetical protein